MPTVAHDVPVVSPLLAAGLILAALPHLAEARLPAPTATDVIEALGVSRTQAYALRARIQAVVPECQRPPGRPPEPAPPEPPSDLGRQVLRFVYAHPGCVHGGPERQRYSDAFRQFVIGLAEHADRSLPTLADAIGIPEETLRGWLRGDRLHVEPPPTATVARSPTIPQVETVLDAWDTWDAGFLQFCDHVQVELRIPFSRALLSEILEANGSRVPRRRPGRSPDEVGLRGQFETFFAGAQWVGDGKTVVADVDGQRVACNLELDVDAHTGAFVGLVVTPTEDAAAVVEAFAEGVATTGARPLALLLDNKPSNHAPEVDQALGDTARIRATPFRPPNKAHVEGAFGLFAQTVPEIVLTTDDPVALVQVVLATTWARATNHRPRADRGGKSRFGLAPIRRPRPMSPEPARPSRTDGASRSSPARPAPPARIRRSAPRSPAPSRGSAWLTPRATC